MASAATLSTEERVGIGVAVGLHVALAVALTMHATRDMEVPEPQQRIVVSMANEVSLESTAPDASAQPAAALAPVVTEIPEPMVQPPVEPLVRPEPEPRPTAQPTSRRPAPTPSASRRPTATPSSRPTQRPTTRPTTRPSSRPSGGTVRSEFEEFGRGSEPSNDSGTPAATFGAAERASLASAITRQLRPHWSAPSGVDVELLVSRVNWRLNRDGTLNGSPTCRTLSGINESNRPQASVHCERAIRAVRTAAPFNLPEQFYSRWASLEWDFDRRL